MPFVPDTAPTQEPLKTASSFVPDKKKKGGFISNVWSGTTSAAAKRFANVADNFRAVNKREASPLQGIIRNVGQGAAFVGDVLGTAAIEGVKAVTPDAVEQKAGEVGIALLQSPTGKAAMSAIGKGVDAYNEWKAQNPNVAKDIEAVVNIASIFPVGKAGTVGAKAAGTAAKAGVKASGEVLEAGAKIAKPAINAAKDATKTAGSGTGRFLTSQATGLSPDTIRSIVADPDEFVKEAQTAMTRGSLGERVSKSLSDRIEELSVTGKEYEAIRKRKQSINIPENTVQKVLGKYGISIDEQGKLVVSAESRPLARGDQRALEEFIGQYGNQTELSPNAFLNTRKALDNLADFGNDKTDMSEVIARDLRNAYDEIGKNDIDGLAALDAKYGPEAELLRKLKREYLNPDGTLKDTALSRLANLTKAGKDSQLARLEEVVPGISKDINILRAVEDIEYTRGQKVGTYTRGGTTGFLATGGNPLGAVVGAIIASPDIAVPLIRQYAYVQRNLKKVIDSIIQKLNSGKKLNRAEQDVFKESLEYYESRIASLDTDVSGDSGPT